MLLCTIKWKIKNKYIISDDVYNNNNNNNNNLRTIFGNKLLASNAHPLSRDRDER